MTWLKILHIATAVLWLGNFVVTGVWSIRAFRTGNAELRRFAVREILFTDLWFTFFVGAAVIMSGFGLSSLLGMNPWAVLWTRMALIASIGSGIAWLAIVLPLEFRLKRLATGTDLHAIVRAFAWWNLVGWTITVVLFSVIYLMVARPT